MKTVAIILAAGSGSRMKSDVKKQYINIGGKPLIYYSIKAFEEGVIDDIVLVLINDPGLTLVLRVDVVASRIVGVVVGL